jgi:uncharacterized protein YfcZ (UPF0381/DUF406 family)
MSRYFFSVRVDSTLIPDDGLELTSLDEAHALALSNLTEPASDPPAEGGGPCLMEVHVADADDGLLLQFRLTFEAVHDT